MRSSMMSSTYGIFGFGAKKSETKSAFKSKKLLTSIEPTEEGLIKISKKPYIIQYSLGSC